MLAYTSGLRDMIMLSSEKRSSTPSFPPRSYSNPAISGGSERSRRVNLGPELHVLSLSALKEGTIHRDDHVVIASSRA